MQCMEAWSKGFSSLSSKHVSGWQDCWKLRGNRKQQPEESDASEDSDDEGEGPAPPLTPPPLLPTQGDTPKEVDCNHKVNQDTTWNNNNSKVSRANNETHIIWPYQCLISGIYVLKTATTKIQDELELNSRHSLILNIWEAEGLSSHLQCCLRLTYLISFRNMKTCWPNMQRRKNRWVNSVTLQFFSNLVE